MKIWLHSRGTFGTAKLLHVNREDLKFFASTRLDVCHLSVLTNANKDSTSLFSDGYFTARDECLG